jgi:glutamate racemase
MIMPEEKKISIAFYDSGIGGLPYFERSAALLPAADFCYLADSAHFPLGEKKREEVLRILHEEIEAIIAHCRPQVIVIACNTASLVALAELRSAHADIAFVGTVPAVKPAALRSKSGKIAVVATSRAIADPYTQSLVAQFASGLETHLIAAPEWVEFVERKWLDSTLAQRVEAVSPIVKNLLAKGVDEIVLACTHFLFLEDAVASLSGNRAEVIDSAQGVSKRVLDLCRGSLGYSEGGEKGKRRLYSSASATNGVHERMAARFGLEYGGRLP